MFKHHSVTTEYLSFTFFYANTAGLDCNRYRGIKSVTHIYAIQKIYKRIIWFKNVYLSGDQLLYFIIIIDVICLQIHWNIGEI